MRPIAIVEDPALKAYAQFLGDLSDTEITLPCRTKLRELIKRVACAHRADLMERVANDCDFFSVTTDIWTDRAVRSFIGLTLHYVDADFEMYNWCLGVQSFPGKHDNNRIAAMLNGLLQDWHLSEKPCTMLLRDGASNAVKAAGNLGVPHMSCVAHSIHLVVSGILQTKAGEHPRQLSLDCPTRWNSTWEMLQCFEEMKSTLKAFEEYFYTVAGMDEISGVRLDFPTDCDWLVAECMRMILNVFTAGSKLLSVVKDILRSFSSSLPFECYANTSQFRACSSLPLKKPVMRFQGTDCVNDTPTRSPQSPTPGQAAPPLRPYDRLFGLMSEEEVDPEMGNALEHNM